MPPDPSRRLAPSVVDSVVPELVTALMICWLISAVQTPVFRLRVRLRLFYSFELRLRLRLLYICKLRP
jgi:hypothetical protein